MAFKKLKYWFDKDLAILLAKKIILIRPDFPTKSFVKNVDKGVLDLELKPRVELIADELNNSLKGDYEASLTTLLKVLGPENQEETGMFSNFYWIMPIAKYVEKYGIEHFDLSINAILEITKRNTGEYTIRPYINRYPNKTIRTLKKWSKDKNRHVRRLACEGLRPRLPWATKFQQFIDNPKPILPILDNLKDDTSKYVQKSVANCLNDILKDNPNIAKTLIESWIPNATKERKWIIKHAVRNLLKKQDTWAITILSKIQG